MEGDPANEHECATEGELSTRGDLEWEAHNMSGDTGSGYGVDIVWICGYVDMVMAVDEGISKGEI